MNGKRYTAVLYFIAFVIGATLCIQLYWNYKNYQTSKQQLINDVQTSLDNAVENHFANLAKNNTFHFLEDQVTLESNSLELLTKKSTDSMRFTSSAFISIGDSLEVLNSKKDLRFLKTKDSSQSISIIKSQLGDSARFSFNFRDSTIDSNKIIRLIDSLEKPVEELSSKIIISIAGDGIPLKKIDSLFSEELNRKKISIDYGLVSTQLFKGTQEIRPEFISKASLSTKSLSPYFINGNELEVHFTNITYSLLKRNILGIILSFLLVGAVIACLLYLLKIIQQQKQLAEVKNDLISNLTHEFKTPIATIRLALEGISDFNESETSNKTTKYAKIGQEQVDRLSEMVEKLLETATLDSEKLTLQKTEEDLVKLLEIATQNESLLESKKHVSFQTELPEANIKIDRFHFENAINNILDNAVKYGGEKIEVGLKKTKQNLEITISDSGNSLKEEHKKQLFEKFYRVPKGNTHDIKGYGIGLFYTQKIIEKHEGSIALITQPNTCFKITLPNDQ